VSGPDLSQVRSIALRLAEVLGGDPHISEISYDWMEPARQVRVTIDQDQARLLGLSSRTIAEVINTLMAGTPITQVRDDIYLIPVITRALDEQRSSLSTLRALQLPLPNGRTVPLSQVATFDFKQEYPLIWRRQRVPTLTVLADVPPAVSPAGAVDALAPAIEKFRESLPRDYHIAVGGTVEESANSQASVFAKVPLMLLLMLFFLMAQLHSFSRLFLVVSVIPMGLIGIVFTLLIVGKPLGFVAILGILALFGMIARNAVLLIEQIETERTQRPHVWDAVVEATLSRFRPIMLTAISTVLGFIPIAADVFWGPMAFAIMGGLFVATILTLIVLPALYVALFRIKEPAQESVAADPPGLEVQR
jgi:multidrug efflux pump subunit AcrB